MPSHSICRKEGIRYASPSPIASRVCFAEQAPVQPCLTQVLNARDDVYFRAKNFILDFPSFILPLSFHISRQPEGELSGNFPRSVYIFFNPRFVLKKAEIFFEIQNTILKS